MFMEKSELVNTFKLYQVRKQSMKKSLLIILFNSFVLLLINISAFIALVISKNKKLEYVLLDNDYTILFLLGTIIAVFMIISKYRIKNQMISIYPQTNQSRFLSFQMIIYQVVLFVNIAHSMIILIQYAFVYMIKSMNENIIIPSLYQFQAGLIIASFFTALLYLFLITSILSLCAAIVRKFGIYAILSFISIVIISVFNFSKVIGILKKIFAFLIFEKILGWFFVKGIVLFGLLFAAALFINNHTPYHAEEKKIVKPVLIIIIAFSILGYLFVHESNIQFTKKPNQIVEVQETDNIHFRQKVITIDASLVEQGSEIKVSTVLPESMTELKGDIRYKDGTHAGILIEYNKNDFEHFYGEKIKVKYSFSMLAVNDIDLIKYSEPELYAELIGNTLYINYTYKENVKVILMPSSSYMSQFKRFELKVATPYTKYTTGSGNIYISVE